MCTRDDYPPYPKIAISGLDEPHCSGCASTDALEILDDEGDLLGYSECCNEPVALGGDCANCTHQCDDCGRLVGHDMTKEH